ncbi:nuclear transport factor 2 family protein [Aquipuribacter sp. SD81]|uniref:nuclear transport factor 2 family protein n=1 Tax=Aquipuribacter sp. SD81 TaxID=3127703 RepID=UPI003016C9AE
MDVGTEDLAAAERRLLQAQRTNDVAALDGLLHPGVVGRGPDGSTFTKEEDLDAYRSGRLRIVSVEERSVDVQDDGTSGVTRTVVDVEAVQGGATAVARMRYTRLWVRSETGWQVLAAVFEPV